MTGTKIVGAALASVALLSCATKPVITAQDYKTGAFTVCGSPQASKDDLSQRAVKACIGATPPKVLRCTVDARYSTVGIEGEVTVSGNCCDYTCRPIGASQPMSPATQNSGTSQLLQATSTQQ
jgi:hypothetical protein